MKNHELFPPGDDGRTIDVVKIHVTRAEGGAMKFAPHTFPAEELPDLATLYEMFGGGRYELIARDETKIVARRAYVLDGPSKPLAPQAETAAVVAPPVAPAQGGGVGGVLLALLPTLAPALIQMLMQQQQSNQQFMMTLLNAQGNASKEHVALMQQAHQQQAQAMAQLSAALIEAAKTGGGGNPREWIALGATLAGRAEAGGGDEDDSADEVPDFDAVNRQVGEFLANLERMGVRLHPPPRRAPPQAQPPQGQPPQDEEEETEGDDDGEA